MEELTALYGWGRIQTPGFEDTALFARTSGEASDVVNKEMYTFTDRGDRSLTLRPEGTAPIARAYLEQGLDRDPQPVKAYTIAPMYRYGRPGRGRYREHWQLSLEAIGSADPAIDAEVIQFYAALFGGWRMSGAAPELIGDAARRRHVGQLNAWLDAHPGSERRCRRQRATSPCRFDEGRAAPRGSPTRRDRRGPGEPTEHSTRCAGCSTHGAPTCSTGSGALDHDAHRLRVRPRRERTDDCGGGATTGSSRRSEGW
jgi:histidyl-tRNA synthetase